MTAFIEPPTALPTQITNPHLYETKSLPKRRRHAKKNMAARLMEQSVRDHTGTPAFMRCRIIHAIVHEMLTLSVRKRKTSAACRRTTTHARHIAMYISHVVLAINQHDIGHAFGKDRSTISYACKVVEERRDDPDFDFFIERVEKIIISIFFEEGISHAII